MSDLLDMSNVSPRFRRSAGRPFPLNSVGEVSPLLLTRYSCVVGKPLKAAAG